MASAKKNTYDPIMGYGDGVSIVGALSAIAAKVSEEFSIDAQNLTPVE